MENRETIKIQANTNNIVEFLYDTPKEGTNNYGAWYLYGFKKGNKEVGLFATETLHNKIRYYGTGDTINIRKEELSPGKFAWTIIPEGDTPPRTADNPKAWNEFKSTAESKSVSISNDARTHDIHKQVCLKLAVDLVGDCMGILTDSQLVSVEANMKALLGILEAKEEEEEKEVKEDLPF